MLLGIWPHILFLAVCVATSANAGYMSPNELYAFQILLHDENNTQFFFGVDLSRLSFDMTNGFWMALGFNSQPNMVFLLILWIVD